MYTPVHASYHKEPQGYHNVPQGYHKEPQGTTMIPQGIGVFLPRGYPTDTSRYHKDFLEYSEMSLKHTTKNPWSALPCQYMVPQGIPGVLGHDYITSRYHKQSLEYLTISIKGTTRNP
jgi:hypothetical protein